MFFSHFYAGMLNLAIRFNYRINADINLILICNDDGN